jgi:hypothetical protein
VYKFKSCQTYFDDLVEKSKKKASWLKGNNFLRIGPRPRSSVHFRLVYIKSNT